MLEVYEAYADYDAIAELTRELIQEAARLCSAPRSSGTHDGSEHDLGGVWPSLSLYDAVSEAVGEAVGPDHPCRMGALRRAARPRGGPGVDRGPPGRGILRTLVVPGLIDPVFVRDFPATPRP